MNSAVSAHRLQTRDETVLPAPDTAAAAWARHAHAANGFGDLPTNDAANPAAPLTGYDAYRTAQAHRAVVLGEMLAAGMQALGAIVRRAYLRSRERRAARAAYEALRRLDDRTLRDLGFHRSEVMSVAAELTCDGERTRVRLESAADRRASSAHDAPVGVAVEPRRRWRSRMPTRRYASSTPRAIAALAAAVMTAITIGAFVVVPASVEAEGGNEAALAASQPGDTAVRSPTLAGGVATLATLHRRTLVQ